MNKTSSDFEMPAEIKLLHSISDCGEFLKQLPDKSIQLICIDPPYNLKLAGWDIYENYIEWASKWIDESYRVLSDNGSMVIFGGIQFRDAKSGDLLDIIQYIRKNTKFKLVNTIIWHYKNGMSAHRFFANRHEEVIWLVKSNDYYFDLDSVRVPYSEKDLKVALRDKRLNPETTRKGKNPINANLCENRFVRCNGATIMLQAASIYTKGEGGHWDAKDMIEVMMDVARTSLKMLGKDLFDQLTKK